MVALFAACAVGVGTLVKLVVYRPRPSADLVHVFSQLPSSGFPSGHVLAFTAFGGFLAFLVYTLLKPSWGRTALLAASAMLVLLMGLSRIYQGQHWFSDVMGAYLLGSMWLALSIWLYRWGKLRFFTHQPVAPETPGRRVRPRGSRHIEGPRPMSLYGPVSPVTVASDAALRSRHALSIAVRNPWIERLERFGLIVRGIIYVVPGVLALQLALGRHGAAMTQTGAIEMIGHQHFGSALLVAVAAFAGLLGYLAWVRLPPTWPRTALIASLLAAIALMGIARIYAGEHWASDVLGGYLLGSLWLGTIIELYRWARRTSQRSRSARLR